jgi:nucleoside-diphosphate-sugar epimerase
MVATAGKHKVVLAARRIGDGIYPKKVKTFEIDPNDPSFRRVFEVCSIEVVVFFIARGEHAGRREGELNAFQYVLEHSSVAGVRQIILISSGEVYSGLYDIANNHPMSQTAYSGLETFSETTPPVPNGPQGCLIKAAEDLCHYFKQNTGINIVVLRLPYVYQRRQALAVDDGLIARLLSAARGGRGYELPGAPDTPCDFLSEDDAARLILLIVDEGFSPESACVNTGSDRPMTFGDMAELFASYFPALKIAYSGDYSDVPPPMRNESARREYGWIPLYNLADDFLAIKAVPLPGEPTRRAPGMFLRRRKGFIIIEFALVTALLQYLSVELKGFSLSHWIDFRLLFVVAMSLLHGTVPGIVAALIASAMLFLSHESYNFQVFMYNTENWIPFAFYIIVGVVLGNSTDKQKDGRKAIDDKLALAERTTQYITDLCNKAVQEKDQYRDQILSYRDNYGRIYAILQKLNSEMTEYVLSSAVQAMEDVLENATAAIYFVSGDGRHARLTACSKGLTADIARSIRLDDFGMIMEKALGRDFWFNQGLHAGYPAYCAPVFSDGRLIALIMIHRASVGQMTLYYNNLFIVLSGLIQESLARAIKYRKMRDSELYYTDTRPAEGTL